MENPNKFVDELRVRMVGKRVTAVLPSSKGDGEATWFRIITDDGKSFTFHATELGAWVHDSESVDGIYPSMISLCHAVDAHRQENGYGRELPDVKARVEGAVLVFDAFDGKLFRIIPDSVLDDWEKSVLTHPKVLDFIGKIVQSGELWKSWFFLENRNVGYDAWINGDRSIIPEELMRPMSTK